VASLRSELKFASLLTYAPQGVTATSMQSKEVCAAVKGGHRRVLERAIQRLAECSQPWVATFFAPDRVLVPIPRSSPLRDPRSLWVARDICQLLSDRQIGGPISTCLRRTISVPKSAFALPQERPSPSQHFASFDVDAAPISVHAITLVDDVVTKGATLIAAASRLDAAFPGCDIRAFALIRTVSRNEVPAILGPCEGVIHYERERDASRRRP
jgi:predicted amidophosphoribosyltransferase